MPELADGHGERFERPGPEAAGSQIEARCQREQNEQQ